MLPGRPAGLPFASFDAKVSYVVGPVLFKRIIQPHPLRLPSSLWDPVCKAVRRATRHLVPLGPAGMLAPVRLKQDGEGQVHRLSERSPQGTAAARSGRLLLGTEVDPGL